MSMTLTEYENLDVGDLVIFDGNNYVVNARCEPLLDGAPHEIIKAGIENGFYRIGFKEVSTEVYGIGYCYQSYIRRMTKINYTRKVLELTKDNLIDKKVYANSIDELEALLKIARDLGFVWVSRAPISLGHDRVKGLIDSELRYISFHKGDYYHIMWGD